ncbi:transcriptional activator SPT8 [Cryptococcus neoformans c8]|nr:transcriptional activator SPT8 [Cryptococcus neoformans var. grubii AD1-83a]OXG57183.1 transcriptional activator SPT8 [Cryptococcus neoformans var. grubii MW-RSA1955]OXG61932.1 transcriptional activator SPT8 [Cryptococcus neoformans var. grubii CHC193]OXG62315.1 transcriptional activator SPT8 [Cryptococcus neoformans var. grubii c8]OXH08813.1 transcriptional activator SPT8 [Cryptococcus neoformans var. grubii A5-35-17]OXH10111.1 transcriptional activator SPT8 [Cryptococcus neoformans var. g
MRSEEEDDDDEYYDEHEEEDDERASNGDNGEAEGDEDDADEAIEEASDEEGSDEDNAEEDAEVEDEEEEEEEEDGEAEEDEEDERDEEEDGEEASEDEADGEDVTMAAAQDDEAGSIHPSQVSKSAKLSRADLPPPPHLIRRSLFKPAFMAPPTTLSVEAIVGIPLPTPVQSLASSTCLSYLLTGGQDGFVRAYDFWGSVNGSQMMTAQQRSVVGLGEGMNKAGLPRGWWTNEVEGIIGGTVAKRTEPVYSMACEGDALWALTGTQSGPINLSSLRHSPGHLVHTLKGHTNVVSCMTLLPEEKGFISGSWDGTVREWDLNTGQTVRTYPTHKAQLSSVSLRPVGFPSSPTPSPRPKAPGEEEEEEEGNEDPAMNISISMGPDFFGKKEMGNLKQEGENGKESSGDKEAEILSEQKPSNDIEMADAASAVSGTGDSLFGDDDAEGETAPASILPTTIPSPSLPSPPKPKPLGLALPGQRQSSSAPISTKETETAPVSAPLFAPQASASSARQGAADVIPVLSPVNWKAYSEDVLLTSSMDGQLVLIDRRVPSYEGTGAGVGRLLPGEKTPPWCMSACWLSNGNQVLAGRRNGTVEIWDVRKGSSSTGPNLLRSLKTPVESGPISCVVAFPDGRHIATASQDNIRLWNAAEVFHSEDSAKRSKGKTPFKIIAGHHGGTISSMIVDRTCRFLITASGDRGWGGESTKAVLIHEVKW